MEEPNQNFEINRLPREKYRCRIYHVQPDGTKKYHPMFGAEPYHNVNTARNKIAQVYPKAAVKIAL